MTTFTDIFGADTVPPSDASYSELTPTASVDLVWPYNTSGSDYAVTKIMDLVVNVASLTLSMPDATQVSTGEDILFRNVGTETITIADYDGNTLATVAAGQAKYLYLANNVTTAGEWGVIAYGVGTSAVDAASLIGYGIMAVGASLNQSHPVTAASSGFTVDATYRAKLINYTGGAASLALTSAATLGDNFFTLVRNSGTGTLTIDPASSETVDGQATLGVQPGESLLLFCSGTAWFSVGYGRSVIYNFTQLVLDVSAAGTFTLSTAQAANKLLTFTGSPASAVTVVVPNTVAVYYILSSISTAQGVTVKTAAGTGAVVAQGERVIVICDSTNVYSAQSVAASSSVSLIDGSASTPALSFASQTNTGLFKYSTTGIGFSVAGTARYTDNGTTITIGTLTGIIKRASGVESAAAAGTDYVAPGAVTTNGVTMATARLLGRTTASTGAVEEISVGSGLTLSGGTLSAQGSVSAAVSIINQQFFQGL